MALLFGMMTSFPFIIPVGSNVRSTDVLSLLCLSAFAVGCFLRMPLAKAVVPLAVIFCITIEWIGAEIWYSGYRIAQSSVQIILVRWILALFAAYYLNRLAAGHLRRWTTLGLLAGLTLGLLSIVVDAETFSPLDTQPTLEMEDIAYVDGVYRAQGMFSHPNEAAGIVMLVAPLTIGMIEEGLLPPIAALFVVVFGVVTFTLTQSRSEVAIGMVLLLLWLGRHSRRLLAFTVVVGILATAAVLLSGALMDDSLVTGRIMDSDLTGNISDRLLTVATSLQLVLSNPFGLGSTYAPMLDAATGFSANGAGTWFAAWPTPRHRSADREARFAQPAVPVQAAL